MLFPYKYIIQHTAFSHINGEQPADLLHSRELYRDHSHKRVDHTKFRMAFLSNTISFDWYSNGYGNGPNLDSSRLFSWINRCAPNATPPRSTCIDISKKCSLAMCSQLSEKIIVACTQDAPHHLRCRITKDLLFLLCCPWHVWCGLWDICLLVSIHFESIFMLTPQCANRSG